MVINSAPMGPGWFMFFYNHKTNNPHPLPDHDRILKDDNEILEIVTMLVNCDVFD